MNFPSLELYTFYHIIIENEFPNMIEDHLFIVNDYHTWLFITECENVTTVRINLWNRL